MNKPQNNSFKGETTPCGGKKQQNSLLVAVEVGVPLAAAGVWRCVATARSAKHMARELGRRSESSPPHPQPMNANGNVLFLFPRVGHH